MMRWINEKTRFDEYSRTVAPFPPESERMNIEQMILGYTINCAKQLGIEDKKGSIEAGKDADFLVFEQRPPHGRTRKLQLQYAFRSVFCG